MKAAWLITNFTGLGLIVYGAMSAMDNKAGVLMVVVGMCCMAVSVQLRKRVFRKP